VSEVREHHPLEASQLLALYRRLYESLDQARGKSPEEVLALRRESSVPIMEQMRQWLDGDAAGRVLPKSRLGEAVRYLKNQWDALAVFLGDGRVPIDNDEVEQLMKQVATGRKNWLFIGSVEAGYRASILLTIVSTAHRHQLDVWLYVKDVLDRLLAGERDLSSLRADRWAQSHPEAIRPGTVLTPKPLAAPVAASRSSRTRPANNPPSTLHGILLHPRSVVPVRAELASEPPVRGVRSHRLATHRMPRARKHRVFDREAYSPEFFRAMCQTHRVACITYHKYRRPRRQSSLLQIRPAVVPECEQLNRSFQMYLPGRPQRAY
jgi:hypothetical protein